MPDKEKDIINTDITDKDELDEIKEISGMLNPDEKVLLVAKQSRFKPGGSQFSPNIVYATDRRIILRDPSMLGLREEIIDIPYSVITNAKIDKGLLSASVIFNAPGLFNPRISSKKPGIKKLETDEHGEDGIIEAIPKGKAEDLIEIIRRGIIHARESPSSFSSSSSSYLSSSSASHPSPNSTLSGRANNLSYADELAKIAELKDKGIITEEEFKKMKNRIIGKL